MNYIFNNEHSYTLYASGLGGKNKSKEYTFSCRRNAEDQMYKLCKKYACHIVKVWEDGHFKSYFGENGEAFHINRV